MKLLKNAIDLVNKLEEGVGEVPPQVPFAGNVSYYQSVDEQHEGEWGPWHYNKDGSWRIYDSELKSWKKDPWGRPWKPGLMQFDEVKDSEGGMVWLETLLKDPDNIPHILIIWND